MSDRARIIILLLGVLVAALAAGTSDFEDAKRAERAYCEDVVTGEAVPFRDDLDCSEVLAR